MLVNLWRFVVVWALMFWQGGFFFYAAVVVHAGQSVVGHQQQGQITSRVTIVLNWAGVGALLIFALEMFFDRDPRRWRRWFGAIAWLGMAACQAALFWLHERLAAGIDSY